MERYAPYESPLNRASPNNGQWGARPADAFDALAWRAPGRPATVTAPPAEDRAVPRWMVIAIGCLVAVLMGVIAGSALAL